MQSTDQFRQRVYEYWLFSLKFEIFKFWKFSTVKSWRENHQIKIPQLKKTFKIKNLMDWVQKQVLQDGKNLLSAQKPFVASKFLLVTVGRERGQCAVTTFRSLLRWQYQQKVAGTLK